MEKGTAARAPLPCLSGLRSASPRGAGFNVKEDTNGKNGGLKPRPWVHDYMRNTAISMYLAKHKHEGEAATWAGNSPNVIHRHYMGLVKEADATEFWNLTPVAVKSEFVTLLTTKAA